MVAEKVSRDGFTPLVKANTRSHAPADAETFKALAGRPRWLYEMATGEVAGDTSHQARAPLNPSGRLGHDHSGPPYGSAIQHPIFTFSSSQTASEFTYDDGSNNYDTAMSVAAGKTPSFVADVYVRPFAQYEGAPYSRAHLTAGVLDAAAGSGDLEVELWTEHEPQRKMTSKQTITDTSFPPQFVTFPHAYWRLRPGHNRLYGKFKSYSGTSAIIYSVSGNILAKRSHIPGPAAIDIDANDLASGAVSTWTNRGTLGGSFSANTAPNCSTSGGPESTDGRDAYVTFDRSNSESMSMTLSSALGTGVHFGCIFKSNSNANLQTLWDGNDATNRNALWIDNSPLEYVMTAGTGLQGGTPDTNWHRIVGRYGTDGALWVDGTEVLSGTTNTNVFDAIELGRLYTDAFYGDFDLARLLFWTNEEDIGVIDRWLAEQYPSIY